MHAFAQDAVGFVAVGGAANEFGEIGLPLGFGTIRSLDKAVREKMRAGSNAAFRPRWIFISGVNTPALRS